MQAALVVEALPPIAAAVASAEVLPKAIWARLAVAASEANFTGSALLMTTFTMTTTTGSAWWARSLTTTAIMTTGPTAGSRSASTPQPDGVGTASGPATSNASCGGAADAPLPLRPLLGQLLTSQQPSSSSAWCHVWAPGWQVKTLRRIAG